MPNNQEKIQLLLSKLNVEVIEQFFAKTGMLAANALSTARSTALGVFLEDIAKNILGDLGGDFLENYVITPLKNHAVNKEVLSKLKTDLQSKLTNSPELDSAFILVFLDLITATNPSKSNITKYMDRPNNRKTTELLKSKNLKQLATTSNYLFRNINIEEYLADNSPHYNSCNTELQEDIAYVMKQAMSNYLYYKVLKTDEDDQIVAKIIISVLSESIDAVKGDVEEVKNMLTRARFQSDAPLSVEQIEFSSYTPKYIFRECPYCKYNGPRIYTNEKTNLTTCAACGVSYQMIENAPSEIVQAIEDKTQKIVNSVIGENADVKAKIEQLSESVKQVQQGIHQSDDTLTMFFLQMEEALVDLRKTSKQESQNVQELADTIQHHIDTGIAKKLEDALQDQDEKHREEIAMIFGFAQQINGLNDSVKSILQNGITREYLDNAMVGHDILIERDIHLITDKLNRMEEHIQQELAVVCSTHAGPDQLDSIVLQLKEQAESSFEMNVVLSQQLVSIDQTVQNLYLYAHENFPRMTEDHETIIELLKKQCTKEYFEDFRCSLGTDINQAVKAVQQTVSRESANHQNEIHSLRTEIRTLSISQISQIIATLDDMNKKTVSSAELSKIMRNELSKTSGQIFALKDLVETTRKRLANKMDEYRDREKTEHGDIARMLREINRKIDEQGAVRIGEVLMDNADLSQFKKIYFGKIPSKYMADGGYGFPFKCPYCGVIASRVINEDQYCKCSACRQEYIPINSDYIREIIASTGKREEDLPSYRTVRNWIKKQTAEFSVGGEYRLSPDAESDEVIIINDPNLSTPGHKFSEELQNSVKVIIFTNLAVHIDAKYFDDFYMLETVIFQQNMQFDPNIVIEGSEDNIIMSDRVLVLGAKKSIQKEKR